MPRGKSSVFAIRTSFVSLGLLVTSWILVGWGAVFANAVGTAGVALGGAVYFRSRYYVARCSKVQGLTAIVILLGALLGPLTVLTTAANVFEPSFYAALAISILLAETRVFLPSLGRGHSHAACLYERSPSKPQSFQYDGWSSRPGLKHRAIARPQRMVRHTPAPGIDCASCFRASGRIGGGLSAGGADEFGSSTLHYVCRMFSSDVRHF
jgi:hypothetical protein